MGSSLPPFQSSMSATLSQTGMGTAMETQKTTGLLGMENKTTSNTSGSNPVKNIDLMSSGSPGMQPMDHTAGIKSMDGWHG